jgi:hypothetical protein
VSLWSDLSGTAHTDSSAKLIKQILYIWHWNLLPLALLIPSMYLYLKSNRRNLLLSISFGAIFVLIAIITIQVASYDLKIQRFYFYIAPFAFILTAWGTYALLKNHNLKHYIKKGILLTMVGMIIISIYAAPHIIESPYKTSRYDGLIWTIQMTTSTDNIASTGLTIEARGCGLINMGIVEGLITIENPYALMPYLKTLDIKYVVIPSGQGDPRLDYRNDAIHIFANGDINAYMIL